MQRALKRSEQVARLIVRDIVDNSLAPDTPLLPEAAMLKQYGVSRASLREGLRILEVHGIVTLKPGPNGGPRVGSADALHFAQMSTLFYEANGGTYAELASSRVVLEPIVAALAAKNRTAVHVAQIESWLERQSAADHSDVQSAVALSNEIHQIVADASGNRILSLIVASFDEAFAPYYSDALNSEENVSVAKAHDRIARAIIAGDADGAEKAMRRHMEAYLKDFATRDPALMRRAVGWL